MDAARHTSHKGALWYAAMVHRLSGLALAVFLPMHFLVLGLAIESDARLQGFLLWAEHPLVKIAEAGLVALLAVHLLGGLRLLVIENLAWRDWQKAAASMAAIAAVALASMYLFAALA